MECCIPIFIRRFDLTLPGLSSIATCRVDPGYADGAFTASDIEEVDFPIGVAEEVGVTHGMTEARLAIGRSFRGQIGAFPGMLRAQHFLVDRLPATDDRIPGLPVVLTQIHRRAEDSLGNIAPAGIPHFESVPVVLEERREVAR